MPAKIFKQLMKHPLTDKGLDQFMKDWAEVEAAGNALKSILQKRVLMNDGYLAIKGRSVNVGFTR